MSEWVYVKNLTATELCNRATKSWPLIGQDTEEVEGPGHVDDGVSGLWLLPWGELDDLLGCLEELGHAGPGTVAFRALEEKRTQTWSSLHQKTCPLGLKCRYSPLCLLFQSCQCAAGSLGCPAEKNQIWKIRNRLQNQQKISKTVRETTIHPQFFRLMVVWNADALQPGGH